MRLNRRVFLGSTMACLLPADLRAATQDSPEGLRILAVGKARHPILPAPAATTAGFGFGGQVPGPPLRYKKGEEVKIRLVNAIDQPVTFSCQSLRIPNAMDGVAGLTQKPVLPGQFFDYHFTPPDSGFYWYRSDVLPYAIEQIDRGLYGTLIVEETHPPKVDHDMTVVLAEWHLDESGQLLVDRPDPTRAPAASTGHYVVTVNSESVPLSVNLPPSGRVRLRLLSLIQSHLVFMTFAGLRPLIIAIDGQPCEAFAPLRQTIPIGPGACFDVMCDLPAKAGTEATLAWRTGEPTDRPLIVFSTRGTPRPELAPLSSIDQNPLLPAEIKLQDSHKAELTIELAGTEKEAAKEAAATLPSDHHGPLKLNGTSAQNFAATPLFSVKRGTPVTLGFNNKTAILLQIYVHGHALRLLHDRDDGWEPYWRSHVIVPEGRTKRVAFVADNPGKWAIECQTLELRPSRLVSWFEVK